MPDQLPFLFNFADACEKHDNCYGCVGRAKGMQKKDCDNQFLEDMKKDCDKRPIPVRQLCKIAAAVYHAVVTSPLSEEPWNNAQKIQCP